MKRKLLGLLSVISGFAMSFFAKTQIYAEDIKSMLDGEGAAGDGGALEPINNMTDDLGKGAFTIGKKGAVYVAAGLRSSMSRQEVSCGAAMWK